MANYFPLIVETGVSNTINQLPAGDFLDLSESGIANSGNITMNAGANINAANIIPLANVTYDLGAPDKMWGNIYVGGNTIYLGSLQLKDIGSNTFAVYTADGSTQANIDVGSIDVSGITQGTSVIGISGINGNAYITANGTSNVLVVSSTGAYITGLITASGNITGGNLLTTGLITASGNIDAGNLLTTGLITASGNITGGNLLTTGLITASGNITGGNLLTTGSMLAVGNVAGDTIFGNAAIISGNVSATGNAIVGNLSATNIVGTLTTSSQPNITSVGALSGLSVSGNIIPTSNVIYDLGNATNRFNDLYLAGNSIYLGEVVISADGANLNLNANVLTANFLAGTLITNAQPNVTSVGTLTSLSVSGTVTGGNLATAGTLSVGGTITSNTINSTGEISTTGNVIATNVTGNVIATNVTGTLTTNAQPNVTSVGTLTSLSVSGNVDSGNLNTTGVFATTLSATGNISTGANLIADNGHVIAANGLYSTSSYNGTYTDGIVVDYVTGNGRITTGSADGLLIRNEGVAAPEIIFSIDLDGNTVTPGTFSASGNIYSNAELYVGNGASATGLTNPIIVAKSSGLYYVQVAAQNSANTGSADLVAYADNGNDSEAWIDMGFTGSGFNDTAYTITQANDGYIFALGGNTGGSLGGNLVIATGSVGLAHDIVFATGGFLNSNERMRFIDATQQFYINPTTNATSTITGALRVAGGAGVGGNIYVGGLISATGEIISTANVSGNNLSTSGVINATGTITGGNLSTTGTVTATGNATVGNLSTGGTITATGNIVGGNIVANTLVESAAISATGTVTAGNIVTGGTITATGNIQSNGTVNTNTISSVSGALTVATGSGDLILNPSGNIDASNNYINNLVGPIQASDAATKEYVDNAVSTGITIHDPVLLESPTALTATYALGGTTATVTDTVAGNTVVFSTAVGAQPNDQLWFANSFEGIIANTAYFVVSAPNTSAAVLSLNYSGSPVTTITSNTGLTESVRINSGVGATLTNAGANATLQVDGVTVANTNRILVYQQANAAHNGVYVVSEAGNATTAWQLTRSTDTDLYGPSSIQELDAGDYFFVQSGDTGAGESYVVTAPTGPIIFGYSNLVFTQFSSSQVYSANTAAGLSLSGTVFSAKVDNDTTAFSSGNIVVKAGANLTTPNIGAATGTSLSLTGTASVGNVSTGGEISATGNIIGNYFQGNGSQLTGIDATSIQNGTSNVRVVSSGGDVTTSVGGTSNVIVVATTGMTVTGTASVTGTATVGNVSTGGEISATGNITGGNILGGANVNATLFTGTTVSVLGNVSGGNVLSSALIQGVTLSASGNVNGANLTTAGTASATGTITGGNLETAGTLSVGGTTTGNIINAITISASGNVTGGNILFGAGNVSGTGNINTSGNVNVTDRVLAGEFGSIANSQFFVDPAGTSYISEIYISPSNTTNGYIEIGETYIYGVDNASNWFEIKPTGNTVFKSSNVLVGFTDSQGAYKLQANGNAYINGLITASGNITGGNIIGTHVGNVSGATTISASGNITGGNILFGAGVVSGTGNISAGNAAITGNISSVTAAADTNTTQLATTAYVIGQASAATPASIGTNTIGTSLRYARADHTHTGIVSVTSGGGITASVSPTNAVTLGSTATSANTAGAIVARDGSGNFSAGTITATLSGTATNANTAFNLVSAAGIIQSTSAATAYSSAIQVREASGGGGNSNAIYSPRLAFHWAGIVASSIIVETSGRIAIMNNPGTSYEALVCAALTASSVTTSGSGGNITGANVVSATTILTSQIQNSGSSGVGNIGNSSVFFNTVFAKATSAQYADLAEAYAADAEYPPGTVLVFGGNAEVTLATNPNDAAVAGVVSTNPAHVMNSGLNVPNTVVLALTGRVPTRVVGPVRKGQMMVSAGNGHAQACAVPAMGTVIGKALENFNGETGIIEVVVGRL